ncbi:cation-transporting P-type ATPase [Brevibacterium sp. 50QC2O2]|uniref:cation-translocating P-type ATPase n=1 Tax=Brevibacterium sp. 50QC2O2 TaxID=2968459 RepID=UPI00211C8884|nr:cation-transporting P-type ATPase [Brevibacterium sp. 50QC2O2]
MSTPTASTAYQQDTTAVLSDLGSGPNGLTSDEAARRLTADGPNRIATGKQRGWPTILLAQFRDMVVIMLLISAVVVGFAGELSTAIVFVLLVLANAGIGFVQELRAQRTMESLQRLVHPSTAVVRDGRTQTIATPDLVVGDVVEVQEGDSIPADIRLIRVDGLSTSEFALTGESGSSRKSTDPAHAEAPLAERQSMAFAGTLVAAGEGTGIVTATAADTELGKIADLSSGVRERPGPLQREMAAITKTVGIGVICITAVLLAVALATALPFLNALLFAVGLAAALIPQGLPAEVSTALAGASAVLARQNVLVKRLNSVETLGCTSVICTDKTGTLTKNQMTVTQAVIGGVTVQVTGTGYSADGALRRGDTGATLTAVEHGHTVDLAEGLGAFLATGVFASTAEVLPPDDDHPDRYVLGDPTEGCLIPLAEKAGLDPQQLRASTEQLRDLPFDSERKRMTSVRDVDGSPVAYVKGAPASVLERCTRILVDGPAGTVRDITAADRSQFLHEVDERAGRGLRNLAFAIRSLDRGEVGGDAEAIESDLTLLGLVSMIDPLHEDIPAAMDVTHGAGIAVNVITGDTALTAAAIAQQAHLSGTGVPRTVTDHRLHSMSDAEVLTAAESGGTVFSRVNPEDKMRIVTLLRNAGHVVAVTGDGINDAPALRAADIGVAMGKGGTDVAKDAAQIVLLDDSFSSLVGAVRQGRRIYANIRKGVLSCLTSNVAEFVVNGVGLALLAILGVPLPIPVTLLLAIDVLGEILPIAALGSDPEEDETLKEKPRDPSAHILNRWTLLDLALSGLVMGCLAIGGYLLAWRALGIPIMAAGSAAGQDAQAAATVTYVTVLCAQLAAIVQRRSAHGVFTRYQLSNRIFWLAIGLAVLIMIAIVYVPVLQTFFNSAAIPPVMWAYVAGAVVVMIAARTVIARLARR